MIWFGFCFILSIASWAWHDYVMSKLRERAEQAEWERDCLKRDVLRMTRGEL